MSLRQPAAFPLCLYSQSVVHRERIVRVCPLGLTEEEHGGCPMLKRKKIGGLRVSACTADQEVIENAIKRANETVTIPKPKGTTQMSTFRKGTRQKIKLRMAIDGPSGAGKTATSQRIAMAMAQRLGGKVCVICSEHGSAEKYIGDRFADEEPVIDFDIATLSSYAPTDYTAAIEDAGRAGASVLIIDSLSHAWEGKDGVLELVDKKGKGGGWKDATPLHRRMVEAILTSPCHVIVTMRSKTEYVYEPDAAGKVVPRKVGMAPIQRPGMEYEFDVYMSMDWSHLGTVTKSRCPALDGAVVVKPGAAFADRLIDWLEKGSDVPVAPVANRIGDEQVAAIAALASRLGWDAARVTRDFAKKYHVQEVHQLSAQQAADVVSNMEGQIKVAAAKVAPAKVATPATAAPTNAPIEPAPAQPATAAAAAPVTAASVAAPPLTNIAAPVAGTPAAPAPAGAKTEQPGNPQPLGAGFCDIYQLNLLQKMRAELMVLWGVASDESEKSRIWKEILAKRGVDTAKKLTPDQAAEMIKGFAKKINELHAKARAERGEDEPSAEADKF